MPALGGEMGRVVDIAPTWVLALQVEESTWDANLTMSEKQQWVASRTKEGREICQMEEIGQIQRREVTPSY